MEGEELPHLGHIDAVAIWVADLRRRRSNHDTLRIRAGEDAENRLAERRAPDDGVVNADERVAFADSAVGDIVDVRSHLHPVLLLGDERAQLDVLVGDLFAPRPTAEYEAVDGGIVELALGQGFAELVADLGAAAHPQFFHQPVPGYFGRVRDVGEDRLIMVVADEANHLVGEGGAEGFPFGVDVRVVTAREIDALKGAMPPFAWWVDGLHRMAPVGLHDERGAGRELLDFGLGRADDGHECDALRGDGDQVVRADEPAGADAVRVADDEGVAVADEAGDGVATVPVLGRLAENIADVEVLRNLMLHGHPLEPLILESLEQTVVFLVEPEADFLEDGLGVGRVNDVGAALGEGGV